MTTETKTRKAIATETLLRFEAKRECDRAGEENMRGTTSERSLNAKASPVLPRLVHSVVFRPA